MTGYSKNIEVRWSDMDPNFHLRHSVYYDWAAFMRLTFLLEHAITPAVMRELHFGPILFREECVFKREVAFGDKISVNLLATKSRRDLSRWSMIHEIWKNNDTLSAVVTVDGAWLDTKIRKLATPPAMIQSVFDTLPKAENFEWTD
jgi:acyl-CoA thioester hydrolase